MLFRYGAIVLFNLTSVEEVSFIKSISPFIIDPSDNFEIEEVELISSKELNEGVNEGRIVVREFSVEVLQIVASVLAKSIMLAFYEISVAKSFDLVEPFAISLKQGSIQRKGNELLIHVGETLAIQSKMVGRVEVGEKPELLWEMPELERLYLRLQSEYEIQERHLALERKLDLISRTAETLLDLLQNRRSLRVEWYIVILIVVEIFIMLLEKVF